MVSLLLQLTGDKDRDDKDVDGNIYGILCLTHISQSYLHVMKKKVLSSLFQNLVLSHALSTNISLLILQKPHFGQIFIRLVQYYLVDIGKDNLA